MNLIRRIILIWNILIHGIIKTEFPISDLSGIDGSIEFFKNNSDYDNCIDITCKAVSSEGIRLRFLLVRIKKVDVHKLIKSLSIFTDGKN